MEVLKKSVQYLLAILLLACNKDASLDELRNETPVLAGVISANSDNNILQYFSLPENSGAMQQPRSAMLRISTSGGVKFDLSGDGINYELPDDLNLQPDSTYLITALDDQSEKEINATFSIPPQAVLISGIADTIHILAPGSVAGIIDWVSLDPTKYSYMLKLECIEEDLQPLPLEGNLFTTRYNGPQLQSQLLLLKSDFGYYGRHKLTVFAIDKAYESVFFYDPSDFRGLIRNGPSNVIGGSGFVTGITSFETEMIISD